jgi:ligand-binding sensor domain-containing protein/signal transduction histidine kinase
MKIKNNNFRFQISDSKFRISDFRLFGIVAILHLCAFFVSVKMQNKTPEKSPTATVSPSVSPSISPSPSPTKTDKEKPAKSEKSDSEKDEEELPTAQNFHQWGAVSIFHGLPSDGVRAVVQDKNGVMWFGTDGGLARYDGRRVQSVTLQGVNSERILALKIDSDGAIWIGTNAGALRFLNGKYDLISETLGKAIVSIIVSNDGKIILASADGQLFECSQNENSLNVRTLLPQQIFAENFEKKERVTSVIAEGNSFLLGTEGRSLIKVETSAANEFFSRPRPFFINDLLRDRKGDLWLGAQTKPEDSGFYLSTDIARPVKIGAEIGTVTALGEDANGDIWVGTLERGVFQFRGTVQLNHFTFENTAGGLRSNKVNTIFADREGVLWFGTDKGVCRFDASSPFNQMLSADGNSNFVRTLFLTRSGQILVGTNRGLYIARNEIYQNVAGFERRPIYAIAENADGQIFVGTSSGTFTLENRQILPEDTRSLINFQGKIYAAVFGRGIERIEVANRNLIFPNVSVTNLSTDNQKIYVGTAKDGIFTFDGKIFAPENSLETLKNTPIRNIKGDFETGLWIAAERGLFLFQNTELKPIAENLSVRNLVYQSKDEIWAATNGGVMHTKFDAEFGWLLSNLNVEQGLPSQNIFALLPLENSLLIGTNRGTVRYVPSKNAPLIIPSRILSQRLHQPEEANGSGIKLDFPQNSLAVEVSALSSRTFPEQFQYGFLLKNSKGEVLQKKISRDAQFLAENLAPNDYLIEVRAFDKDLLSSAPLTVKFSVGKAPFPWTSTALAVLLTIAVIALIWAVIERRRITKANHELAAARFDLANEAERERKRIARDLHDQTLADLRNLMMSSDKISASEETNANFRTEIEAVSDEIRRICEDLSPSVLENVGLTAALEFLLIHTVAQTENKFEYEFVCEETLEERLDFAPNVQMQIYRIAQEILNNISRHSEAQNVKMSVFDSSETNFNLKIENDGNTFDPKEAKKGRGLSNIKSRASLIEAETVWEKSEAGAMIFTLQIDK